MPASCLLAYHRSQQNDKTRPLTEAEYSALVSDAVYYLQQPEVQEDPKARALVIHTGDILRGISLSEDLFLAEEVWLNLRQLQGQVAEADKQQVTQDSSLLVDPPTELPEIEAKEPESHR